MAEKESSRKVILDLCGGTGAWSRPYSEAGYDVRLITLPEHDVRLYQPPVRVHGILAAPPCTHLSSSGARWWKEKGEEALLHSLSIVDACIRLTVVCEPVFWCLENPVGRLVHYLGKPRMYFHPWEYGDLYQKRTCLWGRFNEPVADPALNLEGQKLWRLGPSTCRSERRSITPPGFAKAFFEANP
jgi:hypothetical protein